MLEKIKFAPTVFATAVAFMTGVGPQSAEVNLCEWLGLFASGVTTNCLHGFPVVWIQSAAYIVLAASAAWYFRDRIIAVAAEHVFPSFNWIKLSSVRPVVASGRRNGDSSAMATGIVQSTITYGEAIHYLLDEAQASQYDAWKLLENASKRGMIGTIGRESTFWPKEGDDSPPLFSAEWRRIREDEWAGMAGPSLVDALNKVPRLPFPHCAYPSAEGGKGFGYLRVVEDDLKRVWPLHFNPAKISPATAPMPQVPVAQRPTGKWVGSKYVYDEPVLAFSTLAQPIDNNRDFHFDFLDARPNCIVGYKIVLEGRSDFISVVVKGHPTAWPRFSRADEHVYSNGSTRINENRDLWLHYFIRKDATPIQVRIYVTYWDIGDGKQVFTHDKVQPYPIDGGTF